MTTPAQSLKDLYAVRPSLIERGKALYKEPYGCDGSWIAALD